MMKHLRTVFTNRPFLLGLITGLVVLTAGAFAFEAIIGAHPECAVNDSVGPCDLPGRVAVYWPLIAYLSLGCGAALVTTKLWLERKRQAAKKTKAKAKKQVVKQQNLRFMMWLTLTIWMLMPLMSGMLIALFIFISNDITDLVFVPISLATHVYIFLGWVLPVVYGVRYLKVRNTR